MIIKGTSIAGANDLGPYLSTAEKNELIEIVEVRGTVAQDVTGALQEMEAYAEGTQCTKPLYHGKISPEPPHRLSPEQRTLAVDKMEKELGLDGQPRVIVVHKYKDREHLHVVWARIDVETMRAIPDSHNFRKHEQAARELEREFGHPRVQGAHAERDGVPRPDRTPSRSELRQEERTGIKGKDVKAEVTAAYNASDTAEAFVAALEDAGYVLARGDRRDFVIADRRGGIHSLGRRIDGIKAADLRLFMAQIDYGSLPSADQARDIQLDRQRGETSYDIVRWGDELAASAIARAALDRRSEKIDHADLSWDDALAKAGIEAGKKKDEDEREDRKRRRAERGESFSAAIHEKQYARGDDYVSQTTAALSDYEARTSMPRPRHPAEHASTFVQHKFRAHSDIIVAHAAPSMQIDPDTDPKQWRPIGSNSMRFDYNEFARERYERLAVMHRSVLEFDPTEGRYKVAPPEAVTTSWREFRKAGGNSTTWEFWNPQILIEQEQRAAREKPLGTITATFNHKDAAEARYKWLNEIVYGGVPHDQSGRRRQAEEDATRAKEAERKESESAEEKRNKGLARQTSRDGKGEEADSKRAEREQRRLSEEQWQERSLDTDDPNRQRGAPGRGRSRSR